MPVAGSAAARWRGADLGADDVGRFDVAVDHAQRVKVFEGRADVQPDLRRPAIAV